jgi:uncharacterized protein YutE (UPF0331/DUF86 family)
MKVDPIRIKNYLSEIRKKQRLKPFFDFRNSLIHRYWIIDDQRLISNIQSGRNDFDRFLEEIETYLLTSN